LGTFRSCLPEQTITLLDIEGGTIHLHNSPSNIGNWFSPHCRVQILRAAYLSAGEFNPILKPACLSHSRGGSNSQLAKSTLRWVSKIPSFELGFYLFPGNRIELPCKEITASSYAAPGQPLSSPAVLH